MVYLCKCSGVLCGVNVCDVMVYVGDEAATFSVLSILSDGRVVRYVRGPVSVL